MRVLVSLFVLMRFVSFAQAEPSPSPQPPSSPRPYLDLMNVPGEKRISLPRGGSGVRYSSPTPRKPGEANPAQPPIRARPQVSNPCEVKLPETPTQPFCSLDYFHKNEFKGPKEIASGAPIIVDKGGAAGGVVDISRMHRLRAFQVGSVVLSGYGVGYSGDLDGMDPLREIAETFDQNPTVIKKGEKVKLDYEKLKREDRYCTWYLGYRAGQATDTNGVVHSIGPVSGGLKERFIHFHPMSGHSLFIDENDPNRSYDVQKNHQDIERRFQAQRNKKLDPEISADEWVEDYQFVRGLGESFKGPENSKSFTHCLEKHGFLAQGCNGQRHRGPTVFGMILAFAGCKPEEAYQVANGLWGTNGIAPKRRCDQIQEAQKVAVENLDASLAMQKLFLTPKVLDPAYTAKIGALMDKLVAQGNDHWKAEDEKRRLADLDRKRQADRERLHQEWLRKQGEKKKGTDQCVPDSTEIPLDKNIEQATDSFIRYVDKTTPSPVDRNDDD